MPKFNVTITYSGVIEYQIDAKSEDEAKDLAKKWYKEDVMDHTTLDYIDIEEIDE